MVNSIAVCFVVLLFIILATAIFCTPVYADQTSAQNAISLAEETMKDCYDAVKQAEFAGANVSTLTVTLNEAAGLLSKAKLSYVSGDYNSAFDYASQSGGKLEGFVVQTSALRVVAIDQSNKEMFKTVLSVVVSITIFFVGLVTWFFLNQKERRTKYVPKTSTV